MFKSLGKMKSSHIATKCNHKTKQKGKVSAFGHSTKTSMPINKSGSVDWCLDCIEKMAIQCAWCGNAIFIGEPITLYSPGPLAEFFSSEEPSEIQKARWQEDFVAPDYAVVYQENPLVLVGCLYRYCADPGADRAGFWFPGKAGKGEVWRIPTVHEKIMVSDGNSGVLINDINDSSEAVDPTTITLPRL